MLKNYIEKLTVGENLSFEEMHEAVMEILNGTASEIESAGFLVALRSKGETVEEITAAAKVMREKATKINAPSTAIDTCGTGGDGVGTFNISTIASIVVAGAGIPVAKHGNRSVSSKSGSADLIEALGIKILSSPEMINVAISQVNYGFLFAPNFHRAMKNVARTRKELGIRTLFNLLG
ncbi:MAG: anthranilate phosphoribosyltransferase, partial [Acetomicrobium sp.]|nr:anthranilate phosphoribosyltransferase [Acetomicrobium sp.]